MHRRPAPLWRPTPPAHAAPGTLCPCQHPDPAPARPPPYRPHPARALRCAAQPAALPAPYLADQPLVERQQHRPARAARADADRHVVHRQADHRRGDPPGGPTAGIRFVDPGIGQRPAQPAAGVAGAGTGAGDRLGPARPPGRLRRCLAVGVVQQRGQRAADGTRRAAGSGGFRRPRPAGQAGSRTPPDHEPHEPDEPVVRPGAGCDHRGQPCGWPAGVCALVDRAAGHCVDSGLHRRGAFQCAGLFAQLPVDPGAPPARLPAPGWCQRRNRQGSEDPQPAPVSDYALPPAGRQVLPGQSRAGAQARCGARCWRHWARWAITRPMATSPGARCAAISASAI